MGAALNCIIDLGSWMLTQEVIATNIHFSCSHLYLTPAEVKDADVCNCSDEFLVTICNWIFVRLMTYIPVSCGKALEWFRAILMICQLFWSLTYSCVCVLYVRRALTHSLVGFRFVQSFNWYRLNRDPLLNCALYLICCQIPFQSSF